MVHQIHNPKYVGYPSACFLPNGCPSSQRSCLVEEVLQSSRCGFVDDLGGSSSCRTHDLYQSKCWVSAVPHMLDGARKVRGPMDFHFVDAPPFPYPPMM